MDEKPHLTARADSFAKRIVKRPPVDERTQEEKLVEFHKKYDPLKAIKEARKKVKHGR